MRNTFCIAAAITAAAAMSTAAFAKTPVVQAVQVGFENVRYDKGVPTVDLEQRSGAVQIRPLPMDHGSFAFIVVVFNDGNVPANMDISNIAVRVGTEQVGIMNVDRLIKKAKNRTFWSQFGVAMLGGIGSAAAASERNTYRSTYTTPYGTYRGYYSAPSLAGQMRAARIEDQTAMGIAAMQAQLDETREALSDQVVQLTTVDPGQLYAGKIILEKIKTDDLPQQMAITIDWNGETYPFAFQIAEAGTPAPAIVHSARAFQGPVERSEHHTAVGIKSASYAPGLRSVVPPHVDMEGIIKRTAEVMPRPFALESGTALTSYKAAGTELILTANAAPSIYDSSSGWEQAAHSEICSARPFASILRQGGIVRATYLGKRKKELGTVEASGDTCRSARRS